MHVVKSYFTPISKFRISYGNTKKSDVVERRRIQATVAGRYRFASLHLDIFRLFEGELPVNVIDTMIV
jgi:hypothetical protein